MKKILAAVIAGMLLSVVAIADEANTAAAPAEGAAKTTEAAPADGAKMDKKMEKKGKKKHAHKAEKKAE